MGSWHLLLAFFLLITHEYFSVVCQFKPYLFVNLFDFDDSQGLDEICIHDVLIRLFGFTLRV